MNIIWINEYASLIGGCEYYILNTVRLLKEQGIGSTLLYAPSPSVDGSFLEAFDAAFPMVDLERQLKEIPHDLVYVHQLFDNQSFKVLLASNTPVFRFFQDCNLFHLHMYKDSFSFRRPIQRVVGRYCFPLLFSIERSNQFPGVKFKTYSQLTKSQRLNQKLDGFIAGSHFIKNLLVENGFDATRTHMLPLYAEKPSEVSVEREQDLILFVGQLIRGKGVDLLLKALKLTAHPYRLVIAGTGKQEKEFQSLTEKLGLSHRVQFIGKVNQKELDSWYKRASCVVLPTRIPESFGLVGIEAMRYGTPVIAPLLGGISDWLEDGKTGLAVDPEDPKEIAQSLDRLWNDKSLVQNIHQIGLKRYQENYTPSAHVNALLDVFRTSINNKSNSEKFTFKGLPEIEAKLQTMLNEIKEIITTYFTPDYREALLLIGGYGKGEGGVEVRDGYYYPHNNLDLLLLTKSLSQKELMETKQQILDLLIPINQKYQIGIDISVMPFSKLIKSTPLLIWYEMYHGHHLLLGNAETIAQLPFGDIKKVPQEELIALLINRGSLLIINDWIFDQGLDKNPRYQKIIIKHMMKAIIGYGDALLFFLGDYHWSYEEKLKRILKNPKIPKNFALLYKEAAHFRFEPNYSAYLNQDLKSWTSSIRPQLAEIFLKCESIRLQTTELNFDNYADIALKKSIFEGPFNLRGIAKKVASLRRLPHTILGSSWETKLGFCMLSPANQLRIIFPFLAFHNFTPQFADKSYQYLKAKSTKISDLRIAYLKLWGTEIDANFFRTLKEWDLSL